MNKRISIVLITILLLVCITVTSSAATNADDYFSSATISLYTFEGASFTAATMSTVGFIRVDSCWLEKWNGSDYIYYCWLPAPSDVDTNTSAYDAYMDYASYIPNDGGKYRVGAYFNADNHTIRRFSNGRTFN